MRLEGQHAPIVDLSRMEDEEEVEEVEGVERAAASAMAAVAPSGAAVASILADGSLLESCLRCSLGLARDLVIATCGHVYHQRCVEDWTGCVACDDAVYRRAQRDAAERELNDLFDAPPAAAAAAARDDDTPFSVLRQHLGNRRRAASRHKRDADDAGAPAAVRSKPVLAAGLTKLFFDPQAVIDAMLASDATGGSQSSSQDEPASQKSPEERAALLEVRQEELHEAQKTIDDLERDIKLHEEMRLEFSRLLDDDRTTNRKNEDRVKKYHRKVQTASGETYKVDKKVGELRDELRHTVKALIALDSTDQQLNRLHAKDVATWRAAKAAASSSTAFSPPPALLSSAHHYLQLQHNNFWRDLLRLDPNLIHVAYGAVHGPAAAADVANQPRVPARVDLLELGVCAEAANNPQSARAGLPSLSSRQTLDEMTRLAATDASILALGLVPDGSAVPAAEDVPEPSESELAAARSNSAAFVQAQLQLLHDFANDPHMHRTACLALRSRCDKLMSLRRQNEERNTKLTLQLKRAEEQVVRTTQAQEKDATSVSVPSSAAAPSLAPALDHPKPALSKSRASAQAPTPSLAVAMDLTDDPEDSPIIVAEPPPVIEQRAHEDTQPDEPMLPAPARATSTSHYVPTSGPSHSRSTFLMQAPASLVKQRLAAALEAVDRLPSAAGGIHSREVNISSLASWAAAPAPTPTPTAEQARTNPFGLRSAALPVASGAALQARARAPRTLGGDFIVRGHDGRGGHVQLFRPGGAPTVPPPQKKPRLEEEAPPARAPSPSTALFSLDSLAYRAKSNVASANTRLVRSTSSSSSSAALDAAVASVQRAASSTAIPSAAPSRSGLGAALAGTASAPSNLPQRTTSASAPTRKQPIVTYEGGREIMDLSDEVDAPAHPFFANRGSSSGIAPLRFTPAPDAAPVKRATATNRTPLAMVHTNAQSRR